MEQTSQENARAGHFTLFDDANPPSVKSADTGARVSIGGNPSTIAGMINLLFQCPTVQRRCPLTGMLQAALA